MPESSTHTVRLPPIGFEGVLSDQGSVQQPKKKRKSKHKLKNIVRSRSAFAGGAPDYHQQQYDEYPLHHHDRRIDYPYEPMIQSSEAVHDTDVVYRRKKSQTESGTAATLRKRFTISELDEGKPQWMKARTGDMSFGPMFSKPEVKDLLRQLYNKPERERTDYVLVYKKPKDPKHRDEVRKAQKRRRFEAMLRDEGFILYDPIDDGEHVYICLQCSFPRLCKEAELVKLQMPLKNMDVNTEEEDNVFTRCIERTFETDNEVDFISAPFEQTKLHLFERCDDPDRFFRSAQRSLLTDHLLKNLDMRKLPKTPQYYYKNDTEEDPDPSEDVLSRQGLPYLLMKNIYNDAFVLHDESKDDFKESLTYSENEQLEKDKMLPGASDKVLEFFGDARHDLNKTWPRPCRFQPLWKIRNYFGEEIAFYFAWMGVLVYTIFFPMLIGIAVFSYGMFCSISGSCRFVDSLLDASASAANETDAGDTDVAKFVAQALTLLDAFKDAFDNNATPIYAITVCIWSTVFLEVWKRKNAVLAYEWDVEQFEEVEPDRPEHFGTATRKDPITQEEIPYYPFHYRCVKFSLSFVTFLFMVCIVFVILMGVIVYRVVMKVVYCPDWDKESSAYCFIVSTVISSVLNALAILILGKVYEMMAYKLTDWENHRTETSYKNSLIIKLFAFQFANCYSSLYYIAFFRDYPFENGILSLGTDYTDSCNGSCMSELSFQVLVLMLLKPVPKLLKDVIIPKLRKKLRLCCGNKGTINPEKSQSMENLHKVRFIQAEKGKPPLQDFTLGEYTEKVIQYGFSVLFAAAMPLAPLLVIAVNAVDRYIDAKRLLWMYRRPVAHIAQDIGTWYNILHFLNIAAVITNAFIIAYVSDWGIDNLKTDAQKLVAILLFEHLIFGGKFLLAIFIPDVPQRIRLAMRKEKYTVAKILETGIFVKDLGLSELVKSSAGIMTTVSSQARMGPEGETRERLSQVDEENMATTENGELSRLMNRRDRAPINSSHPSSRRQSSHDVFTRASSLSSLSDQASFVSAGF